MLKNISFDEAAELMALQPALPRKESVSLEEALWRTLAEDVRAAFPMPPFDKSPFDGYAFRASDVPGTLTVRGESAAGCREPRWLMPEESGFYQPIVIARKKEE